MKYVLYLILFFQIIFFSNSYSSNKDNKKLRWEIINEISIGDNNKKIFWEALDTNKKNNQNKTLKWDLDENKDSLNIDKSNRSTENNRDFLIESFTNQRFNLSQIEPYIPLNNFLESGNINTLIEWKSSFDGGEAGGTGQQNNSIKIDVGISDKSQISAYFAEADDTLYNLIDGEKVGYSWQSFALSLKNQLFYFKESDIKASYFSSLEYSVFSSGTDQSKSIYNQTDNNVGKDKFSIITGSFSIPISKEFRENYELFIVPGISFLPDTIGSRTNGKNFYGNNFFLGFGLIKDISKEFQLIGSYTPIFGPGNNFFDKELNYSKTPIYSFGLNWNVNPRIGLQSKISNGFGSTPATGILTIPSDNLLLYSVNISYQPNGEDTFLSPLKQRDKIKNFGGLTVNNALIPEYGTQQWNINYDSKGNLFGFYGYSYSNIFQLELVNLGFSRDSILNKSQNIGISNNFLDDDNFNVRLGGKILFFSPQKDDLLWMSLRTSVGRNESTNQGYIFSELINTYRFNNWLSGNIAPKYLFSGVKSFGALGVSFYVNLFDNLVLIPEVNFSIKENNESNNTLAIRYLFNENKSIDLYYSNALSTHDLGQILKSEDYKYGIRLNLLNF